MGVFTLETVLTVLPAAILGDVRAPLGIVEELVRGSSEVLLSMSIVALAPIMDSGVAYRTEACFVAVEHELMI